MKKTAEKINSFVYKFTKFDENGWANAKTALPIPYDLVTVETKSKKKITAWWNERSWKGLRLDDCDPVIRWKRKKYEHIK